jgi:hypothetical protein
MLSDISSAEEIIEKSQENKSSGDSSSISRPANNCRRPTAIIGYVMPRHSLCHATLSGKNAIELQQIVRNKRGNH